MKGKNQILYVHGGMTFKNTKDYLRFLKTRAVSIEKKESWSGDYLDRSLGKKFEIIRPRMPLADNARYRDWKIHFERYIPHIRSNAILVGGSLGGIFLAKYLSEHRFPKKLKAVYLICAPFDNAVSGEDLVGGFKLKSNLALLEKSARKLYLLFSRDDDVVPISHAEKYRKKLKKATFVIFKSKNGHFKISKFPEIVRMIKNDSKRK